jgi:hypothetical protein
VLHLLMLLSRCSRLVVPHAPLLGSAPVPRPLSPLARCLGLPPATRPGSPLDLCPSALPAHPRGAAPGCACGASGTAPLVKVLSPIISLRCV